MSHRTPIGARDNSAPPFSVLVECRADGFRILGPIRRQVPETSLCDTFGDGVDDRGLHEASLVVSGLRPRVRKVCPHTRYRAGNGGQEFESVGFDDEDVVDVLDSTAIYQVPDAGCVHVDGQDDLLGEGACHDCNRFT